jgi:hypothetical protein
MFIAEPELFDSFVQSTKGKTWSDAFEKVTWLEISNLDRDEPFRRASQFAGAGNTVFIYELRSLRTRAIIRLDFCKCRSSLRI